MESIKKRKVFVCIMITISIISITFIISKYNNKFHFFLKHKSLFEAVWEGDIQEVEYHIAHNASLEKNEEHTMPPLNAAIDQEHFEIAKLLLEHGANIHANADESGWTALHETAAKNRIDIAQLLLTYGADVNESAQANTQKYNNVGDTPLLVAAYNGHLDMVIFLIEKGADVNKGDNGGRTPLHAAVEENHIEVVKYLLSKNVEVNTWDMCLQTMPLNTAQDNNNDEIITLLISYGAIAEQRISYLDLPLTIT